MGEIIIELELKTKPTTWRAALHSLSILQEKEILNISVNLAGTEIGDSGALAIADFLTRDKTIVRLNLYNTNIGDEGTVAIANSLRHNTSLLNLNLGRNHIRESGARAIADALSEKRNLEQIILVQNPLPIEVGKAFERAKIANPKLHLLGINIPEKPGWNR